MNTELITSVIGIVILYFAYQYLVHLESCLCAQASADGKAQADLKMLKYVELFLIVILVLGILGIYGKVLSSSLLVAMIMGIAIIAVYIIVMIHVYRLYNNMPADCECAIKWPRYVLYVQWVMYTLAVISFVISFIIGFYRGFARAYSAGSVEGVETKRVTRRRRAGRR
jgi:hypothetical protein